jgi:hypothetical protein
VNKILYLVFAISLLIVSIPQFHPVTRTEIARFLEQDKTNLAEFGKDGHNCEWFAQTLQDNAWKQHIHLYRVRVNFGDSDAHIFNAIDTTDLGTIYIEPQADEQLDTPMVGGHICHINADICDKTITKIIEFGK